MRPLGRTLAVLALAGRLLAWPAPAAPAEGPVHPPREGEKAPLFEIQGFDSRALIGEKNLLLVFYQGHF